MESGSNARSEWGWEVEIPKNPTISSDGNGDYSFSGFLDLSGKDPGGFSDVLEDGSVLSGDAMIGLKLGRQTYRQETNVCSPVKRSRASHNNSLVARCQVEGCDLDLASAKDYHRRHRICADHSKSPKVVVAGMERRLHDLSEFDDRKRSCRRRLSAHNARRRRPQPEDIKIGSTHRRPHMGFLVNRGSISCPNSTPQSGSNFKGGRADMMSSFHGMTPRTVNHDGMFCLEANLSNVMEVHHSFSLEATSSWDFRGHEEPSSFDQFIHGHHIATEPGSMPLDMQSTRNMTQIPHDFDYFCSD
ncbi:hypothetical protein E3N88_05786 [Mikania micrantha]|uniref:SBP-type domain-containing protein n=1 Tax=Mikania micrantha TaxID=192012 RepID=A0A5N6PP85_9ASTR|nr:hypothetical protein E3N88_05786 [Mikania micrantha]